MGFNFSGLFPKDPRPPWPSLQVPMCPSRDAGRRPAGALNMPANSHTRLHTWDPASTRTWSEDGGDFNPHLTGERKR